MVYLTMHYTAARGKGDRESNSPEFIPLSVPWRSRCGIGNQVRRDQAVPQHDVSRWMCSNVSICAQDHTSDIKMGGADGIKGRGVEVAGRPAQINRKVEKERGKKEITRTATVYAEPNLNLNDSPSSLYSNALHTDSKPPGPTPALKPELERNPDP